MSYLSIETRTFTLGDLNLEGISLGKQPNGTYNVVFTAFNIMSRWGDFYLMTDTVRNMFKEGSPMLQRVADGEMKQEEEHPSIDPTKSMAWFEKRIMSYDEDNICSVTNKVWLHDKPVSVPGVGDEIYLMIANITPSGPRSQGLISSLDDPSSNTAFSIRSLSNNYTKNGVTYKDTYYIFTADWVKSPGIPVARKSVWSNINMESYETPLTDADKMTMLTVIDKELSTANLESYKTSMLLGLRDRLTACDDDSCIYRQW